MSDGRPAPGTVLCALGEIADPGARGFVFGAGEMRFAGFVVRRGGEMRGWVDRCPHVGTPLAWTEHDYLTRDGSSILCATHGALFRPQDGVCIAGPCAGLALRAWPVTVRDGVVRAV